MNIKEQTRRLWKTCFDDDDRFVDLYFSRRYREEINQVIEKDGMVVSALQAIPYPMTFCGETVPMSYISGACTLPGYRGHGLMRNLLARTHRAMYKDGVLVATLIPAEEWLKNYYALSGYAVCFRYALKVINSYEQPVDNYFNDLDIRSINLSIPVDNSLFSFFSEQMSRRSCCVQHDRDDLNLVLADLQLSGGSLWVARKCGKLAGMFFCVPKGEILSVKEMLLSDGLDVSDALTYILHLQGLHQAECIVPSCNASEELGMARLVDVAGCLRLLAASQYGRELDIDIQVEGDDAIPENNGYYSLHGGELFRRFREGVSYIRMNIHEVTAWVMERLHPYMSLMLD